MFIITLTLTSAIHMRTNGYTALNPSIEELCADDVVSRQLLYILYMYVCDNAHMA